MTLPFLMTRVFNAPLMVVPARLDAFLLGLPRLLAARSGVEAESLNAIGAEMAAAIGGPHMQDDGSGGDDPPAQPSPRRNPGYSIAAGVAKLPLHGVLVRRAGQMAPDCTPLMSYEVISRRLQRAMTDSRVRAILLDIDSPGGEAGGVLDLARDIHAAAQRKPIWAVANDDAFSAAYALASGAQRIWTTESGGVGSVGVVAVHADQSQQDAKEGLRYSYVFAGARKIDGHPHAPLSTEAHSRIQAEVDRLHGLFVETVAGHRGLTREHVAGTQAGLYFGREAKESRLADEVGTPVQAEDALAAHVAPVTRRSAAMSEQDPPEPQAIVEQPAPPADATVVTFATAHRQGSERAVEIMELCLASGRAALGPQLARSEMTIEQVRHHLVDLAAQTAAARIEPINTAAAAAAAGPALPRPITSRESFANAALPTGRS